jgi:hypothetical protein
MFNNFIIIDKTAVTVMNNIVNFCEEMPLGDACFNGTFIFPLVYATALKALNLTYVYSVCS